jgi:hypothetical protein
MVSETPDQRFVPWLRANAERFEYLANGKPWTEEEIAVVAEAYAADLMQSAEPKKSATRPLISGLRP